MEGLPGEGAKGDPGLPHSPVTASDSEQACVVPAADAVQAGPEGVSEPASAPTACSVGCWLPAAPPVYPKVPHADSYYLPSDFLRVQPCPQPLLFKGPVLPFSV